MGSPGLPYLELNQAGLKLILQWLLTKILIGTRFFISHDAGYNTIMSHLGRWSAQLHLEASPTDGRTSSLRTLIGTTITIPTIFTLESRK